MASNTFITLLSLHWRWCDYNSNPI